MKLSAFMLSEMNHVHDKYLLEAAEVQSDSHNTPLYIVGTNESTPMEKFKSILSVVACIVLTAAITIAFVLMRNSISSPGDDSQNPIDSFLTGTDVDDSETTVVTDESTYETETTPPETETDTPETETDPPETETDPPETETDPPETETDPPETETDPPETETDPPETETDPPETKPNPPETETDPPETEPAPPEDSNIIAGGKWDGGPVTWKITTDGELIISGNMYIQGKSSYIWKDYSDVVTKIIVEDGITKIPNYAFKDMTNVTEVYLSNTLKSIGEEAFANCTGIESIALPSSLTSIDMNAFWQCENLVSVEFPIDSQLTEIGNYAFAETGIEVFTAYPTLQTIKAHAFSECESLHTVYLGGGISAVKSRAFENCTGLKNVYLGESLTEIGPLAFNGCNVVTTLELNTDVYGEFPRLPSLTTLVIGGNRTTTGHFSDCPLLSDVTITALITTITARAFNNCGLLKSIMLPDTVKTIKASAFRDSGLEKITIPASVSLIDIAAFYNCPLQEITFEGDPPEGCEGMLSCDDTLNRGTVTVYYPADNPNWTDEVLNSLGDNITAVAKQLDS